MKKRQKHLLCCILTAVMAALCMVLERFASFQAFSFKIGLGFVPIVLIAVLCGPIYAALAWGIADVVGALCFPFGVYHPGFTIVAALMGLVYGLFLHRSKLRWWQVILPAGINCLILGLCINTFWLSQLYTSKTYWGFFVSRLLTEYSILLPLNLLFIPVLFRLGLFLRRRMDA